MSKGLKALKELKKRYGKNFSLNDDERCHIIETTLKDYERVMVEKNDLFKRWTKEHQVLEIIKRDPLMICVDYYKFIFELKFTYQEYLEYLPNEEDRAIKTQEEFELLKEMLLCKK